MFEDSSLKTHRVELGAGDDVDDGSTGLVIIKGLSKTDPVRTKVTANYNDGELTQMTYLTRIGDATEVAATAYACASNEKDMDAETDALGGGVCDYEIMSLTADKITSNDPKELVSIGAEGSFFIAGSAKDALGSTVDSLKSGRVTWKAADADARAVLEPDDGDTNTEILINSDADPGTYNITVEDSGKDASTTVMVTVAGDASMISVSCDPMMIPTDTGLTDCTVAVTDAGGNIPSNLDTTVTDDSPERDQVQVSVRGSSDIKADLIGAKDDLVNLDAKGMATFSIQLPLDAVEGSSITVNVSTSIDDELLRNHTVVTYGDPAPPNVAPMAGAAVADQMLYVGAEVMVQSNFSDADEDMLSYMASSSDDMIATATVDDMGMVTITGVAEGMATITVTASDPMGESAMQTIMVSVMTPNMAPMAGDDVADQMVYVGAMVEVHVSNFSDPDEDMLSYTADSSDDMIATATVDDMGMVTITGVAEGMATITVTASDPMGESAMQTIMVSVMTPNMAPMAGDDVADQMVYVGAMVEVQSNFSDPDEDMLSYTADV